jgi:hypothetical protein
MPRGPGSRRGLFVGMACVQEAPGGNPGTPGTKAVPLSMPHDGERYDGSDLHRMARGKVRYAESPGFRRGLFVGWRARKKPRVETLGHRVVAALVPCCRGKRPVF